jgi:hypothetical protein
VTSGIASKNVDLDSIFDPWLSGTSKARATGIAKGAAPGTDLNALYAPLIYGSSAAATGIQSQGADLNTLFAAKGTAKYSLPINGQTYGASENTGASGGASATLTVTLHADGTYDVIAFQSKHVPTNTTRASGTWNTFGAPSSGFQVLYTLTTVSEEGNAGSGNGASTYTTLNTDVAASVNATATSPSSGANDITCTLRIQIRNTSSGQVVSDSSLTITAGADGSV